MIVKKNNTVFLQGKSMSYVLMENGEGDLLNFHFGPKLSPEDYCADPELWIEGFGELSNTANLTNIPQEYPAFGHNDTRSPAYQVVNSFGNPISKLVVESYKIHAGFVPELEGLPCLFDKTAKADTLEVVLTDKGIGLEAHLYYVVFDGFDVVARHTVFVNKSDVPMTLRRACSANVDLPEDRYELIHFAGEWGRERGMERTPLHRGIRMEVTDTSGRGSREVNPFLMVATHGANETQGQVYGFNLIYSCNHAATVQVSTEGKLRIQQGISAQSFAWELQPGEAFTTPQCVICYSGEGFGALSRQYHKLYREHLMRSEFTFKPRPVLINNWEATYFDFNEEKLTAMAQKAKAAGIDLFVLDDGWFGARNSAQTSLGDWFTNLQKLPSGIDGLAKKINELGLQFGLWFEPEMISQQSELYRAHPDWAIQVPNLNPTHQRFQLVLDLSRQEVCDHVIKAVGDILRCGRISYVKWDMNRNIFDIPAEGFYHKYALGYYRIMKALTEEFPQVLFEGCCSGGGRFDPGVLAYMPQIWTSDNSDAICRLKIQYSTSMCYPLSAMGAHVTAVPNHQVGRLTSLKTRADVAYCGVFGYELDITKCTEEEIGIIRQQIAYSKHIQSLVHSGDFYRLRSPYEGNECIWQVVSPEKDRVFLVACRVLSVIGRQKYYEPKVKFQGLDREATYRDVATGKCYRGDLLMGRGITIKYAIEDFTSVTMELEKV